MSTSWQTKLVEEISSLKGQRRVLNDRVKELEDAIKGVESYTDPYMGHCCNFCKGHWGYGDGEQESHEPDCIKANLEAK